MSRKTWIWLGAMILAALAVAGCGGDSKNHADGDTDGADGEENLDADDAAGVLPLGSPCTEHRECESGLCNVEGEGMYCSERCDDHADCEEGLAGSCCMRVGDIGLCFIPSACPTSDGDQDGESPVIHCEPGVSVCDGKKVMKCNGAGNAWDLFDTCGEDEVCQLGECLGAPPGDEEEGEEAELEEDDTDTDAGNVCGASGSNPGSLNKFAKDLFNEDESQPADQALVYTSNPENPLFSTGQYQYVRLNAEGKGAELAFNLDVDVTYMYTLFVDFVCGISWGQVSLFLDDDPSPLLLNIDNPEIDDFVELDCTPPSGYNEGVVRQVVFKPVCIQSGEHLLKMRVSGKNQDSDGYTIGSYYIVLHPYHSSSNP